MSSTQVTGFNSKPSTHTFKGPTDFVILLLKFDFYSTHSYTMVTINQEPGEINMVFFTSRRNGQFNVMPRISHSVFRKRRLFRALNGSI